MCKCVSVGGVGGSRERERVGQCVELPPSLCEHSREGRAGPGCAWWQKVCSKSRQRGQGTQLPDKRALAPDGVWEAPLSPHSVPGLQLSGGQQGEREDPPDCS